MENVNIEIANKIIAEAKNIHTIDGMYACKLQNLLDTIYCLAALLHDCNDSTISVEQLGYQIQEIVAVILDRIDVGEFDHVGNIARLVKDKAA